MLLYDFLMLLYKAAQICDFKSTSAHCEFTVIVNDLQISVFLTTHFCTVAVVVTPAPKSLLLIIPWAVRVCSKWEAAAVSSTFSNLNLLLLRLNISIVSHPEWPPHLREPAPSWLMGPLSSTEAECPSPSHGGKTRRWQLEATRVFPSGSSDFWRWRICPQIRVTK